MGKETEEDDHFKCFILRLNSIPARFPFSPSPTLTWDLFSELSPLCTLQREKNPLFFQIWCLISYDIETILHSPFQRRMRAIKNTLGIICHFHTLAHRGWLQLSQGVVFKANENTRGMEWWEGDGTSPWRAGNICKQSWKTQLAPSCFLACFS